MQSSRTFLLVSLEKFRGPELSPLRCPTRMLPCPGSQLARKSWSGRRGRKRTKKTRSLARVCWRRGEGRTGWSGGGFLGAAAADSSWRRATNSKRGLNCDREMRGYWNEWRRGFGGALLGRKLDDSVGRRRPREIKGGSSGLQRVFSSADLREGSDFYERFELALPGAGSSLLRARSRVPSASTWRSGPGSKRPPK